ncbi:sugar nucleotide-binding protein [Thalassospiraceae bacterium LMO-JJ14]|nr:sugar nucleotide-binding protein [Thalassospiraceae bacterium LMO-JJ14]
MKRVLIIGGDSMIGAALAGNLESHGHHVAQTTRRQSPLSEAIYLDLGASPDTWPAFPKADTWVLTAAISRLAACKDDPKGSHRINVGAVEHLAARADTNGVHLIYLSSDKVFDGSIPQRQTADAVCPMSEYGRQKAEAEKIVAAKTGNGLVIRLTKVLAPSDTLFRTWRAALLAGRKIEAFTDKTLAPLSSHAAADGIRRAIETSLCGVHHFSGPDDVTYFEAAQQLARLIGASADQVIPVRAVDRDVPAEDCPPFTSLDTGETCTALDLAFDPLDRVLEQFNRLGESPINSNS